MELDDIKEHDMVELRVDMFLPIEPIMLLAGSRGAVVMIYEQPDANNNIYDVEFPVGNSHNHIVAIGKRNLIKL